MTSVMAFAVQVRKETRAILPWAIGLGAGTAGLGAFAASRAGFPLFRSELVFWLVAAHVIGALAVAALSLGHELAHGTLSSLLVQPIERRRVLATKLAVAAAVLVALATIAEFTFPTRYLLASPINRALIIWGPVAAGLGLVPLLTLLTRKPLGGVVFSVTIPCLILVVANYFLPLRNDPSALSIAWYGTLAVSVAGTAALWVLFPRLEIAGDAPARGVLPALRATHATRSTGTASHWSWQLVRKEIRLQQMTVAVSGLYLVAGSAILVAERLDPLYVGPTFETVSFLHAFAVVIIAGSLASAEERQMGTLIGESLQPVAAMKRWLVKSGVAIGVSLLLALTLPVVLMLFHRPVDPFALDEELIGGLILVGIAALYVSSVSSNSLWALLASFPAIAGSLFVAAAISAPVLRLLRRQFAASWTSQVTAAMEANPADPGWRALSTALSTYRRVDEALLFGVVAGFAVFVWHYAGKNHVSADRGAGRILRQLGAIAAAFAGAAIVYAMAMRLTWVLVRS